MWNEEFIYDFGQRVCHATDKNFQGLIVAKIRFDDGSKGYLVSMASAFTNPPVVQRHLLSETEIKLYA